MPNPIVAINQAKVVNEPDSWRAFNAVGPKVCMVTANHPGFLGFQNHLQIGVFPMGGRYGGAHMDMHDVLNPLGLRQYTMWKSRQDHDEMHYQQFDGIFRLCSGCLGMVVEGPWEPVYEIIDHKLPQNVAMTDVPSALGKAFISGEDMFAVSQPYGKRVIAAGDHSIIPDQTAAFESAVHDLMNMFFEVPGFLGYMLLKQIGASAIGSMQLNPKGFNQILQTTGDYPPRDKDGNFETPDAKAEPDQYIVHMEWQDLDTAMMGISRVVINRRFRDVHDKVLATVIQGPYITLWNPLMERHLLTRSPDRTSSGNVTLPLRKY
ncbi:MAG: sulfur oxygenase reductase family protein [Firmicutes bacterium]|nr:sulfur oxygenase reductase family protein [Bacillota bacterium]